MEPQKPIPVEPISITKGKREIRLILLNEYQYRFHIRSNGKDFWRCRDKLCKDRITVVNGMVIKFSAVKHNHPPPKAIGETIKADHNNSNSTSNGELPLADLDDYPHDQNESIGGHHSENQNSRQSHNSGHMPPWNNEDLFHSNDSAGTTNPVIVSNSWNNSWHAAPATSSYYEASTNFNTISKNIPASAFDHDSPCKRSRGTPSTTNTAFTKRAISQFFPKTPINLPKIVLFGDSLTQRSFDPNGGCWGAHLANKFQRIADIVCRGFSGYNSRWLKEIIDPVFKEFDPNNIVCVILWIGANDANEPESCSGQCVPLKEYTDNLKYLIERFEKNGISKARLIVATPPPYNHKQYSANCLPGDIPLKSSYLTERYAKECSRMAQELNVTCADVHRAFRSHPNCEQYFEDGLHFNRLGGEVVYKFFDKFITSKFEQFTGREYNSNDMIFPYWKRVAGII